LRMKRDHVLEKLLRQRHCPFVLVASSGIVLVLLEGGRVGSESLASMTVPESFIVKMLVLVVVSSEGGGDVSVGIIDARSGPVYLVAFLVREIYEAYVDYVTTTGCLFCDGHSAVRTEQRPFLRGGLAKTTTRRDLLNLFSRSFGCEHTCCANASINARSSRAAPGDTSSMTSLLFWKPAPVCASFSGQALRRS